MFGAYSPFSYGYRSPAPLYPSNRRPTPLYPRNASPYAPYDEEAYLRALARERAQREAAARAYYDNPYDELDPYAYHPRHGAGRRMTPEEVYAAQRQRQFEQQVKEREMMQRHLREQERARAQRAQQQQRQAHQPSPQPQPPAKPQPSAPNAEQPAKVAQPTPAQERAASLIQHHYRAHLTRSRALASLDKLSTRLVSLQSSFSLPVQLDFDTDSANSDASPTPKLLFTSHNAPVHGYEHSLTQLLQDLDGVESGGDKRVRQARKELVGKVEQALKELEDAVAALWERTKLEKEEMSGVEEDKGWVKVEVEEALENELGAMQMELMDVDGPSLEAGASDEIPALDGVVVTSATSDDLAVSTPPGEDKLPSPDSAVTVNIEDTTPDSRMEVDATPTADAVESSTSSNPLSDTQNDTAPATESNEQTHDTPATADSTAPSDSHQPESDDDDVPMAQSEPSDDPEPLDPAPSDDADVDLSLPSVPPPSLDTSVADTPTVEEPETASEPLFDEAAATPKAGLGKGVDLEDLDKVIVERLLGSEGGEGVVAF